MRLLCGTRARCLGVRICLLRKQPADQRAKRCPGQGSDQRSRNDAACALSTAGVRVAAKPQGKHERWYAEGNTTDDGTLSPLRLLDSNSRGVDRLPKRFEDHLPARPTLGALSVQPRRGQDGDVYRNEKPHLQYLAPRPWMLTAT